MTNDEEFISVCVWGSPYKTELAVSRWDDTNKITEESVNYLRELGYIVKPKSPGGGWGATAGLASILATIKFLLPLIRVTIFTLKFLTDRYNRYYINWANKNRPKMYVDLSFASDDISWVKSWDPIHATKKIDSMLDASHFLCSHLQSKYPNINFTQTVKFEFTHGNTAQSYVLNDGQNQPKNILRFKKISRLTCFEMNTEKTFSIYKKIFIKRHDSYRTNLTFDSKCYYFVIPSILISELKYKYQILNFKFEES